MKKDIIGIDVGGTTIKAGLVRNNKIIEQKNLPVKKGGQFLIEELSELIQSLKTPATKSVGIGLPGYIDHKKGVFRGCHNLPKFPARFPLVRVLENSLNLQIFIDHDANCFTLSEAVCGQGKGRLVTAGLTLGTGVGFGLIVNQKIYHGSRNLVEFGHTIIQPNGLKCGCGGFGHLESYVSGRAMVNLYQKKVSQKKSTYQIVAEAQAGRKAAVAVLAVMSDYLALGLSNIIYSYNPDIIIIGGGLSTINLLINPACQKVRKLLFYKDQLKTRIVKARTPYRSNIIGATLITNREKYG